MTLVRQGAYVYYKAAEIHPGHRTDSMSLPSVTVIRQCYTFRNQYQTLRNYRFKPHCAENVLIRHNSCVSTKLLLQATHTSSSSFIGRQLCCVWAPHVQKNASTILKTNNTAKQYVSDTHDLGYDPHFVLIVSPRGRCPSGKKSWPILSH